MIKFVSFLAIAFFLSTPSVQAAPKKSPAAASAAPAQAGAPQNNPRKRGMLRGHRQDLGVKCRVAANRS